MYNNGLYTLYDKTTYNKTTSLYWLFKDAVNFVWYIMWKKNVALIAA